MTDRAAGEGAIPAALATGFGTALVMWLAGYLARYPGISLPGPVVLPALAVALLAGGAFAARATGRGWRAGAATGLVASTVNLLVLGSLLADRGDAALLPSAASWIPGSLLAGLLLGAAGGALARRGSAAPRDWTAGFALVTAAATLSLLAVGGLVTSYEAGLAVVDWPNSYGYNMFLYPLSRMTGGIYFEHAHRLFGSLVGLATLVLAALLVRTDRRGGMRLLGLLAFATVTAQGVLGGLRVTGRFTTSQSPQAMAPSVSLALAHGVLGQVFFCLVTAILVCRSPAWRSGASATGGAVTDRRLGIVLVGALFAQLVLGAMQRHLDRGLAVHLVMALFVLLLAVAAGVRAWGAQENHPALRRTGLAVLAIGGWQLLLGFGAFGVTQGAGADAMPRTVQALVATAHQATGALFLASSVALAMLTHRLVAPAPAQRARAASGVEVTAN